MPRKYFSIFNAARFKLNLRIVGFIEKFYELVVSFSDLDIKITVNISETV
jgi:hypothetical protein